MKTAIGINGACGRMGQRLIALAAADPEIRITAAIDSVGHPSIGQDAGDIAQIGPIGVKVSGGLSRDLKMQVLIDFSTPEGTMAVLPECVERKIPLLIATTGHSGEQRRAIEEASHDTAILHAPNTSLAVNVLLKLVRMAGQMVSGRGFDIEILEKHHRYKKDSPSGTALHLARVLQDVLGQMELRHGREGHTGERPQGEIGVHAIRVGDNTGEHTVIFSTIGETLELTHKAHSRDCYASGAILAAKYLVDRTAGKYTMADVLGL